MPPAAYSYIDVAALDPVRERFAAGDAILILSTNLDDIIWANGPGARLFGENDVEAVIEGDAGFGFAAKRQIMSTRGFPRIGGNRSITIRLNQGMASRALGFLASAIALPDGEDAIMLVLPAEDLPGAARETARRAISGFTQPGHLVALIDERGGIEAASDGFAELGITPQALADLAREASRQPERLVKKIISGVNRSYPAGIARLRDEPARHLLMVVDERDAEIPAKDNEVINEPAATNAPTADAPAATIEPAAEPFAEHASTLVLAAADQHAALEFHASDIGTEMSGADELPAPAFDPVADLAPDTAGEGQEEEDAPPPSEAAVDADAPPPALVMPQDRPEDTLPDFADPEDASTETMPQGADVAGVQADGGAPTPAPAQAPPAETPAAPVRFVWRTDAEGRFSALSPEFVAAVGPSAGDVLGLTFAEAARRLALEPASEIADLLERRDTWSGRSVMWPIAGTDLTIPVDLAALPVYSRDRTFEGFRGFGVARLADVVMDPLATGLTLESEGTIEAFTAASAGLMEAVDGKDEPAADPFQGETPALSVAPQPDRRFSDKVIRLAEHRLLGIERSLSPVEKVAFREIGERLKKVEEIDREQPTPPATELLPSEPGGAFEITNADIASPTSTGEEPELPLPGLHPDENVPVGALAVIAETKQPETERDPLTADLFDMGLDHMDAEPPATGADGIGDEPYQPSNYEGWSELTPPIEEALEEAEEAEIAEPIDVPDEPYPAGVAVDAEDTGPEEPRYTETATGESIDPQTETEAISHPEADGFAVADGVETPSDEPYEPSNYEGWSELTPHVEAAIEEAKAAETAGHEAEPIDVPAEPYPAGRAALAIEATGPGADAEQQDTTILSRLPVPILIHSGDVLHYANDEFLVLTGYASVEGLTRAGGLGVLFADSYADGEADDAARALRLRTADGANFPIEALLRAVPWQGARALMLVVRRTGETETPLAPPVLEVDERDALLARVMEMRTIIDTATDGVILIDTAGAIRSISRPAEALFGYESDDIEGKPFVSLFAIESQRAARDYLDGLSDNGVASVLNDGREVIGREAEGRFIPLFMSIGRLPNATGFCAVMRDLTQWKRAEEELTHARSLAERASSQKTDFLARMSHEIRTPLNAIIGFSELMMDERFGSIGNERYRDYLRDINRSGNHVLDLVNDLLDISKIEAGEQEMAHEAVSLNETLGQSVAMMQPQANRERVIIRSSLASRLPDVVADLRSIRQIALNLLSNAIRYTQAGGQVIVSTSYEPTGEVVMRIRDTGIGMTQAEIEQALKPFKQINALKRARGDGTGLGLPLTKAMVEANRARFVISSTPGEGTMVEVTFPSPRVLAR